MVDTGTGPINHPPRQRAGVAAQDRTDPWHIESFDWSRFDSIVHRSPWSGRSICLEAKRTDRQAGIAQPQVVDPQVQLTALWPMSRPTRATTPFLRRPQGQHEATFSTGLGHRNERARSPRPKRQRAPPAADCGAHPASGRQTLRRSSGATLFRFLCLGGGSGSLILVSCRLARWWLRSVRCWAARTHCSATRQPPGKDPPRAR